LLLATSAGTADKWAPGDLLPDSSGTPDASHIGAHNRLVPDPAGPVYCADPTFGVPESTGHYGPITSITTWTSKSTGTQVPAQNLARAPYVLSAYGDTTDDTQAAAVDAVGYTYLDPDTTSALPSGQRALQRLSYPRVPAAVKNKAEAARAEAHLQVTAPKGSLTITKTASDTHKPLAGVAFEMKDDSGKTVTSGSTDTHRQWTADSLTPATYTVHELQAVDDYRQHVRFGGAGGGVTSRSPR
jgi:hypothetical protein